MEINNSSKNLKGNDRYQGYCVDLIKQIAREIGFEYRLYEVYDGTFGEKDENGNWNGLIGEIINGVWFLYTTL